jgi:hypothetical protein
VVTDSTIKHNEAPVGFAIKSLSKLTGAQQTTVQITVTNTVFTDNVLPWMTNGCINCEGSAINIRGDKLTLVGSTFTNSVESKQLDGMHIYAEIPASVFVKDTTFETDGMAGESIFIAGKLGGCQVIDPFSSS